MYYFNLLLNIINVNLKHLYAFISLFILVKFLVIIYDTSLYFNYIIKKTSFSGAPANVLAKIGSKYPGLPEI